MSRLSRADNYRRIRDSLPPGVALVVAAKGRTAAQVAGVVEAGASLIGQNYVQEADQVRAALAAKADAVEWHLIGHLQRNKVRRALPLFDVIQSVDSLRLARAIDERSALSTGLGVAAPVRVFVEINVGGEDSKFGCAPDAARYLIEEMAALDHIRVEGLMTMEPYCEDPDDARPYFRRMRELFEELKAFRAPNVDINVLSMGMTNSWRVAVEEGSSMVRIGTAIFGPRGA
ncbi:MAG: YggS family pyridoxal phosphate-dependent enzyme [Planctomycetota bacterium]|jgi:pyridoxal phosphate enzyme (YggS family)